MTDLLDRLHRFTQADFPPPPETLQLVMDAQREIERLSRPAHEREPPHCSTCGCGLAPGITSYTVECQPIVARGVNEIPSAHEPAAGRHINLPIATWAQALDIIGQCAEIDAMDDHATAWTKEANKFFDAHAASLTGEGPAQPPGDG